MKQVLTLSFIALLSGCVIAVNTDDWEDRNDWYVKQNKNERRIERLQLGLAESTVKGEMGKPDFNESFLRNGDEYVVLYYRTRHVESDGVTTKDETTPLVFVDGELVGWGESALENATAN